MTTIVLVAAAGVPSLDTPVRGRHAPSSAANGAAPSARPAQASGEPELIAEYGGRMYGLAVDEQHVYTTLHSRLLVYDRAALPGGQPLAVSRPSGPAVEHLVARAGIVVGVRQGLVVWDATDPIRLHERARLPLRDKVESLAWVGDEVWLRHKEGFIRRIDVSDPDRPVVVGTWQPRELVEGSQAVMLDLLSLGPYAVALVSRLADTSLQFSHALFLLRPGPGRSVTQVAEIELPAGGTQVVALDDTLVIATIGGRLWGLDAATAGSGADLMDLGTAPLTVTDHASELVADGTRIWAQVPGRDLMVGRRDGTDWRWDRHSALAMKIAPLGAGPREGASIVMLGLGAPALVAADGSMRAAEAQNSPRWGHALPGREGTWLIGLQRSAYAEYGATEARPVTMPPGASAIRRSSSIDDGEGTLFTIDGERLQQWRLDPRGVVPYGPDDLAAAAGLVPTALLAADPGRLVIAAVPRSLDPDAADPETWLLKLAPDGGLVSAVPIPFEDEPDAVALSTAALWSERHNVVRAHDLRGPGTPRLLPGLLDFVSGPAAQLDARAGVVAIGQGSELILLDGLDPDLQRVEGTLDIDEPFWHGVAVAPPLVWSVGTDMATAAHLSLVDASTLAHPDDLGRTRVSSSARHLHARGNHATLVDDGVVQVFRAPSESRATRTPPGGTPAATATTLPPPVRTATPRPTPEPWPGRAWLPFALGAMP